MVRIRASTAGGGLHAGRVCVVRQSGRIAECTCCWDFVGRRSTGALLRLQSDSHGVAREGLDEKKTKGRRADWDAGWSVVMTATTGFADVGGVCGRIPFDEGGCSQEKAGLLGVDVQAERQARCTVFGRLRPSLAAAHIGGLRPAALRRRRVGQPPKHQRVPTYPVLQSKDAAFPERDKAHSKYIVRTRNCFLVPLTPSNR